jgi:potassium-transporting ATPase KdpC subunit
VAVGLYCGYLRRDLPARRMAIGQTVFPFTANGSMVHGPDGKPVGSLLIAQPFTKDEYFQPRPSAASYDASAGTSSALSANNYMLRYRIAQQLGPIVKYKTGPKAGQLVAPDIESWFQNDSFGGQPHIVAQWADVHNAAAQGWVSADPSHAKYITDWATTHKAEVADWIKQNPGTPQPQASDLAIVFFENFSKQYPGKFPSAATTQLPGGKSQTVIEPVASGSDIQSNFFDMWRQDHADADLQDVPGDMVTTSASGLDPHITLENAEYQLDRVASKWATDTKRDPTQVRTQIEGILQSDAFAPLDGLFGEKMINVLQVNLELTRRYGAPQG